MKIGFIGLGIMGKPMVRNLLKAGHEVIVYDVVESNMDQVVKDGAKAAVSSKDAAARCGLVITMLPNSPHVKSVVLGAEGVLEGAAPGTILAVSYTHLWNTVTMGKAVTGVTLEGPMGKRNPTT